MKNIYLTKSDKYSTIQLYHVTEWLRKTNMRRDVFQAIADPNRRAILRLIAGRELTLNELAGYFPISRPAISKHVKILAECGLVVIHQKGRERYCKAQLGKLEDVIRWIEQYHQLLEQRFDRLEEYLDELQQERKETSAQQIDNK